jgi:hypothetical protein
VRLLAEKKTYNWNNIFNANYNAKFDTISTNLMVHLSNSPYKNNIKDERQGLVNDLNTAANKSVAETQSIIENNLIQLRKKEILQGLNLVNFFSEQILRKTESQKIRKEVQDLVRSYSNYSNAVDDDYTKYLESIKILNQLFKIYTTYKLKKVINNQGYYDYSGLFNDDKIKEILQNSFEKFVNVFINKDDVPLEEQKIMKKNNNPDIKTNFQKLMEGLLNEQRTAESKGNWEQAGIYEAIIQYCSGRGISILNYLDETIGSFEKAKELMLQNTNDERLSEIYRQANKHTVHTTVRKNNKENIQKTLEGSFIGSITSPNKGGFILEYLDRGLFSATRNIAFDIDKNKTYIKSETTGKNLNILGKSQKNDLLVTFSLTLNKKNNSKAGKKIAQSNDYFNNNINQIGISIKNYSPGNDVTVHSAGNLDTVINFLKTYSVGVEELCKILEQPKTKYILINDRNNRIFYSTLRDILGTQGAIFTLTPFLAQSNNSNKIDESVDFFLIDQKLIPGSLIMQYANDAKNEAIKSKAKKTSGFYASVKNNSTINDDDIKAYTKQATSTIQWEDNISSKDKYPYAPQYTEKMENLGIEIYNKITFSIEMRDSFRKNLENLISKI